MWWLLLYVEDSLSRLPMLLLGPTAGAVIGRRRGMELSSDTSTERRPPLCRLCGMSATRAARGFRRGRRLDDLLSDLGSLVLFRVRGDDIWASLMPGQGAVELRCKTEVPVGPDRLGAAECVIKRPSGALEVTDDLQPRHNPYGVIAHIDLPLEAGTYEIRWYATEHKRRIHEVARLKRTFPD